MHMPEKMALIRNAISFILYFVKLRISVSLGQYYTANPIDISWRWRLWNRLQNREMSNKNS